MSCLSDKYIDSSASAKTNLRSTNIDSSAFLPETNPRSTSISTRLPFFSETNLRCIDKYRLVGICDEPSINKYRLVCLPFSDKPSIDKNIDSSAFFSETNLRYIDNIDLSASATNPRSTRASNLPATTAFPLIPFLKFDCHDTTAFLSSELDSYDSTAIIDKRLNLPRNLRLSRTSVSRPSSSRILRRLRRRLYGYNGMPF
jgi:hypothetical protein